MSIHTEALDPLLDDPDAASLIGVKPGTLPVWRSTGRYAIPYIKVGRRVKYRTSDLLRWLDERTRTSVA